MMNTRLTFASMKLVDGKQGSAILGKYEDVSIFVNLIYLILFLIIFESQSFNLQLLLSSFT